MGDFDYVIVGAGSGGCGLAERLFADSSISVLRLETGPGGENQSDEQIIDYWNKVGSCGLHAVSTCRMGKDDASVIDSRLRVRSVSGLRIMDTSVPPIMLSGNTNVPMMAMAWRAAELILEDRA